MPYEIIWEPEGVLVTFSGRVTARDLINSARQMHADGRFDERHYVINKLPDDAGWELSEEAFVELSALHYGAYASHPNCRIVFVTTDATLAELIKRILTAPEMASYEIAVFDSPSTARNWLDKQPNLHVMSNVMGFRLR
ncbi:MAG: hypothetical protein LBE81_11060 [Azonexus sp.]|jgi:hypothetical protein|uniref:hypothetical protein n=1 Tax=Azonexus sp. TaxID=1872668 RepID=UPI002823FE11|nr:hypothetical protein [Azonexus sp.]MDR0777158.1 hypothetical protein [Azonexus sp.]